jgi:hypothetical protein
MEFSLAHYFVLLTLKHNGLLSELSINRITAIMERVCQTNTFYGLFQPKCLKVFIYSYIYSFFLFHLF